MAVLVIFDAPNISKKQYDALRPIVKWETDFPMGALTHSCGFDDRGGLHVVDVWTSEQEMGKFFESRLLPGFQKVGITPPTPKIYPLHNMNVFPASSKYAAKK